MNLATWISSIGFDLELCGRLCLVLAHSLWQFALLAALATLLARCGKNATPERIYAIYAGALLLGLAALPVTFVLTRLPGETLAMSEVVIAPQQTVSPLPKVPPAQQRPTQQQMAPPNLAGPLLESPTQTTAHVSSIQSSLAWAPWLVGCYFAGVAVMLLRLLRGLWQNYRLSAKANPMISGPLVETLQALARNWSLRVTPALALTERVIVPQVVGLLRPTILLPAAALAGLRPDELEMILAHELAHVRRFDLWANLVQRLAEAVLFFNPAVWYLSRRISTYREYCCDEATCQLAHQSMPETRVRYAEALLRAVELTQGAEHGHKLAALAASGGRPSELRRRVARLFGEPLREPVRITRGGLATVAAGIGFLLVVPLAWQRAVSEETSRHSDASATIEGRIVLEDGSPAITKGWMYYSSASVVAAGSPSEHAVVSMATIGSFTDHFSCEVSPGKVWLKYFPEGFAPTSIGPLELEPGKVRQDVEIVLSKGYDKRFKVVGPGNQPITGATIVANPMFNDNSSGPVHKHTADAQGKLVIKHMADTTYDFTVQAAGYERLLTKLAPQTADEPLVLAMTPSKPTTGTIRYQDGSPATGAKILVMGEITAENGVFDRGGLGFGDVIATADEAGRFVLDQLAKQSRYLLVIEGQDGSKTVVADLRAGQPDVEIELQPRRDLLVRFHGEVPKRKNGKSILSVRQRVALQAEGVAGYSGLVGEDVPVEITEANGMRTMLYRGLVVDPRPKSQPQYFEAWVAELPEHVEPPQIQMAGERQTIMEVGQRKESRTEPTGGHKVEVVAIGTHDEEPQRWWDAEGKPLEDVPFQVRGVSLVGKTRQLIFRIADLPKDADVTWGLTGGGSYSNGEVVLDGERSPPGYFSNVFAVKEDSPTVKLRVGVATGEWQTVTIANGIGRQLAYLPNGKRVAFAGNFVEKDRFSKADQAAVVVVSHNFKDTNVRVIAVDKSGKSHQPSGSSGQGVGNGVILANYSFRDLLPADIDHFEFQTREYEWTEIKDLPVESQSPQAAAPVEAKPTVEVVAIGTHDEEPQRWWDVEGNVLEDMPFVWSDTDNVSSSEKVWRRVVFHINDFPKDAEVVWNVLGGGSWGDATATPLEAEENQAYFARYVGLAGKGETLGLRIGIASGPWVTSMKGEGLQANGILGTGIIFSGAFPKDDGCVLVLSHNLLDANVRVVAIDKAGKMIVSDAVHTVSASGGVNQMHWVYNDLKPNEVDHFEFQTRLYEWIEIKDLPVEPGKKLAAVQSLESEPEKLGLLPTNQAEWIKKLRSLTDHNPTAFSVGPQMIADLSPQEAWEVVQAVWPEIEIDEVKMGLLKTFEFARHPKVLEVLDLGAADQSKSVREYAYSYLQNYALRDFKQPEHVYESWRREFTKKTTDEVLAANCQWFVDQLRSQPPMTDPMAWQEVEMMLEISGSKSSYPMKAEYLRKAGLPEVLRSWRDNRALDDKMKRSIISFLGKLEKTLDDSMSYENVELSGRNLEGLALLGNVDSLFMNADLSKTDLSNATLVGGAKAFYETNFSEANLKDAVLIGRAALQKANLSGANLENTLLKSGVSGLQIANFDGATIKGTRLSGSFQLATFRRARIADTRFDGMGPSAQLCNFDDAQLINTSFHGASFQAVNLNNTEFKNCDLSTIRAMDLESCKFDPSTPPRYDAATKFPDGFDPEANGWKLIE